MSALGPDDPLRSISAERLLPVARAAADASGVTRLADVTGLDRLGLPVWQAVRPMSRALSVHQGKGATDADARVGALLEAVESHCAECFDDDGPICRFDALSARARAPAFADFAASRESPPPAEEKYRWVEAEDLLSGGALHLPFDLVSLDLTWGIPSPFDRSSNGVATGATRDEAIAVALQELVERDAVIEWRARGLIGCTASVLRLETAPFDWLHAWRERLEHAGSPARFYHVPSISGTPVFICELNDGGKESAAYRAVHGRGCHSLPEIALFKALAEAIQSRATLVAGARDDFLPSDYARCAGGVVAAYGLPLATGMRGVAWDEIEEGPAGASSITEACADAGYPRTALIDLGAPQGLRVVRAFICGLGSIHRRRRAPV